MTRDLAQVREVLGQLGYPPSSVQPLTSGAWSHAFAFEHGTEALILRLGGSVADYEADAFVASLRPDDVPVPDVLARGTIEGGPLAGTTYAISQRVPGIPLEHVSPAVWSALLPQLADVLESLRRTPPPADHSAPDWRSHLLTVGEYPWQAGWRHRAAPAALDLFDRGAARLREVCPASVPISLVHADWINRNVHVDAGRITGIFDWGCSRFGDHLYDLAWFEFWSPWHPDLDIDALVATLRRRWQATVIDPLAEPERRLACLLHIGLDHIVYNTLHGSATGLNGTMERLTQML